MKNYLSTKEQDWEYRAADYDPDTYVDPDLGTTEGSKELYQDLLAFVRVQQEALGIMPFGAEPSMYCAGGYYRLASDDPSLDVLFGSDYIGPSRSWAQGFGDKEPGARFGNRRTGNFLTWSRTLGGHMLWPSPSCNSINQQRGGRAICDRIDLTLGEILHWMSDPSSDAHYKRSLRQAIEQQTAWFSRFKPSEECTPQEWFRSFVDFFLLQGYVDAEYEVMSLTSNPTDAIRQRMGKTVDECSEGSGIYEETIGSFPQYVANQQAVILQRTKAMEAVLASAC